jgi:hypothetical protein
MIGARKMNGQLPSHGMERADTTASGAACPTIHGAARRPYFAKALADGEGSTTPRFYQTKPVAMLKKTHLYYLERMGCADYRKMTTGFVFFEMRANEVKRNGRNVC